MPKRPYEWRVDSHGCYKFDNAALGFGPRDQSAHSHACEGGRDVTHPGLTWLGRFFGTCEAVAVDLKVS